MHLLTHVAYLDAGTGSLIIQSIIGVIAGVAVFWRKLIATIKLKTGDVFKKKEAAKSEK